MITRIDSSTVEKRDEHRSFKTEVTYPITFTASCLRPHLQLEMRFCEPRLPPIVKPVRSIISQILEESPETSITCISPLEIAGDKISALSWRILVRDRDNPKDDPTLIRHLHDLAALESIITTNPEKFAKMAQYALSKDRSQRGKAISELSEKERLAQTLKILKQDITYKKEYENFVMAMSYAEEEEKIHFDNAYKTLDRIIELYMDYN